MDAENLSEALSCIVKKCSAASSILIMIVSRSIARLVWINENI